MIKKLGFSKFVTFATGILAIITLILGVFLYYTISTGLKKMEMVAESIQNSDGSDFRSIESTFVTLHSEFMGYVAQTDVDKLEESYNNAKTKFEAMIKSVENCGEKCAELTPIISEYGKTYIDTFENYIFLGKKAESVDAFITKQVPNFNKFMINRAIIQKTIDAENQKSLEESKKTGLRLKIILFGTSAFIFTSLVVFGLILRISLIKSLNEINATLVNAADAVQSSMDSIIKSSETLSASVTQEAASVSETSSVISQIQATVKSSADLCRESAESSNRGKKAAHDGTQYMADMMNSFQDMNEANADMNEKLKTKLAEIEQIVQLIGEIKEKAQVINDIVFQTKLLSFNASVEAARAGEQGKGFAVVASEVGALAEMSGNAANEIAGALVRSSTMAQDISKNIRQEVENMLSVSQKKVAEGISKAKNCQDIFEEIARTTEELDQNIQTIYEATDKQLNGVVEVTRAIKEIETATYNNKDVATKNNQAVDTISQGVSSLTSTTNELNTLIQGQISQDFV